MPTRLLVINNRLIFSGMLAGKTWVFKLTGTYELPNIIASGVMPEHIQPENILPMGVYYNYTGEEIPHKDVRRYGLIFTPSHHQLQSKGDNSNES